MPVLNPFLRALFQSSVLSHALSAQNYVLLVPNTESLNNGRDRENGKIYAELVEDEDFLGSHILRIATPEPGSKDGNIRDGRGKAKTYTTVNNRTVIIKESMVYTNKGFKHLTQAQLLTDTLYCSPNNDLQQWLIMYISKPLTGTLERISLPLPILESSARTGMAAASSNGEGSATGPKKKDIQTFNDLLNSFPMIARQMQPGLERMFNEFGKELGKPLPPPPSRSPTLGSQDETTQASDTASLRSNGSVRLPFNSVAYFDDEEDLMRRALETAVTAAIDLFQGVDKQQLSFLGATTDLTGPAVERLIERYVAESVHDSLLFPRLCSFHKTADHDLDRRIRQMESLDVSQVGIAIEDSRDAKQDLLTRINRGVAVFRKMGVAGGPQEMLGLLLETQKAVSEPPSINDEEKRATAMTINADILVSLLLLVVIRSQVRHLQARLSYMQHFIYIDDVESGEIGYSLSTLEAVLTYLTTDSGGLRKASKQNQVLWDAVRSGNVAEVKSIFEGTSANIIVEEPEHVQDTFVRPTLSRTSTRSVISFDPPSRGTAEVDAIESGNLSHVFPFQSSQTSSTNMLKQKKRVKMEARSMSISSSVSMLSRTATIDTTLSGIEGDTSIQSLAQTQDVSGNSIPMMAVESQQSGSLQYLLNSTEHYLPATLLTDTTSEGTTLLSAAIQLGNSQLIDILLSYVQRNTDAVSLRAYLAKSDARGRTAAHYMFNAPFLVNKLGSVLPWRVKDKIGHTPLFAICRTYDHADYNTMVSDALLAAKKWQNDESALRLDDHTDFKGNTLLHIINDPSIMHRVLQYCDTDPNAMNDKKFTPLMLASKYGRVDMVRVFFGDPRVDLHLREARGLTAVELAKDDEVRNKIDDLTLFSDTATSQAPDSSGRITSIVRSFFVEDGSTRYILKSGAPNNTISNTTYTITTSRRSLQDFANLAKWLALDHPASYMPGLVISNFRSPFQIHSRPSRAVLYNIQTRLDRFLKILLSHPTFSTHEMLWEFFLVPDMQQDQVEARTKLKSEFLQEKIADDYEPLISDHDLDDVDSMFTHSRDIVRKVNVNIRNIIRRGHICMQASADMAEALVLASNVLKAFGPPSNTVTKVHIDAFAKLATLSYAEAASSPLAAYVSALSSFHSTIVAIQSSLSRPSTFANQIRAARKSFMRNREALISNATPRKGPLGFNLPGTEESRLRSLRDTEKAITDAEEEIERKGKELRYTQEVVVGELAGWTSWREEWGRNEIKRFARGMVVKERERLRGLQRVLRSVQKSSASGTGKA